MKFTCLRTRFEVHLEHDLKFICSMICAVHMEQGPRFLKYDLKFTSLGARFEVHLEHDLRFICSMVCSLLGARFAVHIM